jgi:hypothetical protein
MLLGSEQNPVGTAETRRLHNFLKNSFQTRESVYNAEHVGGNEKYIKVRLSVERLAQRCPRERVHACSSDLLYKHAKSRIRLKTIFFLQEEKRLRTWLIRIPWI